MLQLARQLFDAVRFDRAERLMRHGDAWLDGGCLKGTKRLRRRTST
jgi:hypothetical protein